MRAVDDLLELTAGLPEIDVDAGAVVVEQGGPADELHVLVAGRLVVRRDGEDFAVIDAPGACVGEMAVLLGRSHTASVVAAEPSRLRVIGDATAAFDESPRVLRAVAELLAMRLDLVNRYLTDLQVQYRDHDGGLGMIGDVLRDLTAHPGTELDPGSEREPDPLY